MINHGLSQNAHMSILGNAIRASRQARGMTQAELGERFGISKAAVAMWESGKNIPDQRKMAELTRVLDLDPAVAIGLHDEEPLPPANVREAPGVPRPPSRQEMPKDVPVLGTVSGGDATNLADFELNGQIVDYVRRPPRLMGRTDVFAAYVQGNSVSPWREPGQLIYLEGARPPKAMDYVLVELKPHNGDDVRPALVKRLLAVTPTRVRLRQYTPAKDFEVDRRRILRIFRVLDWDELMGV